MQFRPISSWPPEFSRKKQFTNPFRASYDDTIQRLYGELEHLGGRNAVIELALTDADIRIDGLPRAHARPSHPGVIVSFDSRHGPLRYGTDAFPDWEANLRAIALGLEALRRVDRYGLGKRGEQYAGWRQLGAGEDSLARRGAKLIGEYGSVTEALKATHPDHGGDAEDFRAVQAARTA